MAWWEWPSAAATPAGVVVCVHGLTRQGRDFDPLARELSRTHRVLCPDIVGRGESSWLTDPSGYQVPTYAADVMALLASEGLRSVDWVGTSMGGLIGMVIASLPDSPIRRLVLNDVGPAIEFSAIERMADYVGHHMEHASEAAAADHLAAISSGFGPHSREDWLALNRPQWRVEADGRCRFRYDPAIGVPLRSVTPETAKALSLIHI